MLPGLAVWLERASVSYQLKVLTCVAYAAFLGVAFRTFDRLLALTPPEMSAVYLAFAMLFLTLSLFLVWSRKFTPNPEPEPT
jgi:hypothetical protein